jgi:hypothetical protein
VSLLQPSITALIACETSRHPNCAGCASIDIHPATTQKKEREKKHPSQRLHALFNASDAFQNVSGREPAESG